MQDLNYTFPPSPEMNSLVIELGLHLDEASLSNLKSRLSTTGISIGATDQLLAAVCTRLFQQNSVSKQHIQDCKALFASLCKNRYAKLLETWREDIMKRVALRCEILETSKWSEGEAKRKRIFRKGFIPVLEAFYDKNAFPSRSDKVYLAGESGMSYKQIDIWFQNRRNRSEKRTKTTTAPTRMIDHISFIHCKSHVNAGFHTSCTPQRLLSQAHNYPAANENKFTSGQAIYSLSFSGPAHAFPTTYPPTFDEDPFPCKTGKGLFKAVWFRKSAERTIGYSMLDMSALTRAFERLSLGATEDQPSDYDVQNDSSRHYGEDKFNPTIVRPYPAPLPFLIRLSSKTIDSVRDDCQSERLCETYPSQRRSGRMKLDQLPRRVPSIFYRDDTIPCIDSYLENHSLESSLDSLPALSRCPSESSSSSSSDVDSPLLSPAGLPEDILNSFLQSDLFSLSDFSPESIMSFPETTSKFDFSFTTPPFSSGKDIDVFS